jgi:hypothetical protein
MSQSNAVRRLEIVLDDAVKNGQPGELCGRVLLQAMKLPEIPPNIVNFYELLGKAYAEAESLRTLPKLNVYLKILEELKELFITNHPWKAYWSEFHNSIVARNIHLINRFPPSKTTHERIAEF